MILNRQRRVRVVMKPLAQFLQQARTELRLPEDGVTVRLISDPEMARLNRKYRGKHGPTDVLSFPAEAPRSGRRKAAASAKPDTHKAAEYAGDIAISTETARTNARRMSRNFATELRILILHGMIHLAGYDHETDNGQMERLERRLRRKLGLQA
jgi:probable rRNA maturation factor